jgi:hypothetical protein
MLTLASSRDAIPQLLTMGLSVEQVAGALSSQMHPD